MSIASSGKPAWQRNELFRFFASLKLAVVLLAVLIVGAMAGTIYESSFDAKVARYYVYGAPWFNIWLILLATNLTVSALSRWPWKKHHVAFLVTHLGIITLLTGSLIGRIWGIEGSITLFKGDPPTNRLLLDEHQLRVQDVDGLVKGYRAEFLHHPPDAAHPRDLGALTSGARLSVTGYSDSLEGKLNPRPVAEGGATALHLTIKTAMMGQSLETWLLAGDPQHDTFGMGLAEIQLKRGVVSSLPEPSEGSQTMASPNEDLDLEESIFAFAKAAEQIGHVRKGGSTGASVHLLMPEGSAEPKLVVQIGGHENTVTLAGNLGRDISLTGTPFIVKIENYWPDFRIQDGKPGSISDQPNNPAVLVTISGKGKPVAEEKVIAERHGVIASPAETNGGPPTMPPAGSEVPNHLYIFVDDNGAITYELVSRKNGKSTGKLALNQSLATGWADWQLTLDKTMSNATAWTDFRPSQKSEQGPSSEISEGLLVRLEQNGTVKEQWVPAGWEIAFPTTPGPTGIAYGWKLVPLPIGLELLEFEVQRDEGTDRPASFKSTLRITTAEGDSATGQCWMNHPFSYPGAWWRSWTGLTYKISQASWNPENLSQSTVQILRDPGWLLKWIGSLLVVAGVFMMFYLRPYRRQTVGRPILPESKEAKLPAPPVEEAALS